MPSVEIPPVVYAPTLQEAGATRLHMHRLRDERTALFVYSAIDRLQAQYGEDASWVLLTADDLQAAHQASPFDLLLLDRELYPDGRPEHG